MFGHELANLVMITVIFISHALKLNDITKKIYTLIEHKLLCINCNDETLLTLFVTY